MSAPVLDAAERADFRLLAVLKRAGADFAAAKSQTHETVLHCLLKNYTKEEEASFVKSLTILLDDVQDEFRYMRRLKRPSHEMDIFFKCL
jgi:hypothetical protein